MPQRLGHSQEMRWTTVLERNKLPNYTPRKLLTKPTTATTSHADSAGKGFELRPEAVRIFGIQGTSPVAEAPTSHRQPHSRGGEGMLWDIWESRAALQDHESCCSGMKEELSIHSLMAAFFQTQTPAELREILRTPQKRKWL